MNLSMQNKTRLAFVLMAIVAAMAIYKARQAGDGSIRFKVRDNAAYGYGTTYSNSYMHVKAFLDDNPQVDTLVLHRMPGTKDSHNNLRIARLIRERGLKTHLMKNSVIASGAVDLFIAGSERTMECGALVGVHSWSVGKFISPKDMGRDDSQVLHERFLQDMGVDPAFYVFTREAAEPENMHYMTLDEIDRFGLLTQTPDCE